MCEKSMMQYALEDARGAHTCWVEIHSFEFVEEAIEEGRSVERPVSHQKKTSK